MRWHSPDYSESLLVGLPQYALHRLQVEQNVAVGLQDSTEDSHLPSAQAAALGP